MADQSKIEWTDATWNPVTGCTKVSAGCRNCYAERMARRLQAMGQPLYANGFTVTTHPAVLNQPLRWRKPRRIFVCSMGDLFHRAVPASFLRRVWETMQACPQHTFLVLTKRPERASGVDLSNVISPWPLPNVWLGTSCEDQAAADERIPHLLACPAAGRFVSCEPLLGPIMLEHGWLTGNSWETPIGRKLDWVIVGGESGPKARPMHPNWARGLRDQCVAAQVPYFFKQWGEWSPSCDYYSDDDALRDKALDRQHLLFTARGAEWQVGTPGTDEHHDGQPPSGTWIMHRVGKKRAGRLLDGVEWDERLGRRSA